MVDAYIDHLDKTQNSQFALFMKKYMTANPPPIHHWPQHCVQEDNTSEPETVPPSLQLKQTTVLDWIWGNVTLLHWQSAFQLIISYV